MKALQYVLVALIRLYRWIGSPIKQVVFGPAGRCRFVPTCSAYALVAVRRHGGLRGGWMALKRICRCHPWGPSGPDPVPELKSDLLKSTEGCRERPGTSGAVPETPRPHPNEPGRSGSRPDGGVV